MDLKAVEYSEILLDLTIATISCDAFKSTIKIIPNNTLNGLIQYTCVEIEKKKKSLNVIGCIGEIDGERRIGYCFNDIFPPFIHGISLEKWRRLKVEPNEPIYAVHVWNGYIYTLSSSSTGDDLKTNKPSSQFKLRRFGTECDTSLVFDEQSRLESWRVEVGFHGGYYYVMRSAHVMRRICLKTMKLTYFEVILEGKRQISRLMHVQDSQVFAIVQLSESKRDMLLILDEETMMIKRIINTSWIHSKKPFGGFYMEDVGYLFQPLKNSRQSGDSLILLLFQSEETIEMVLSNPDSTLRGIFMTRYIFLNDDYIYLISWVAIPNWNKDKPYENSHNTIVDVIDRQRCEFIATKVISGKCTFASMSRHCIHMFINDQNRVFSGEIPLFRRIRPPSLRIMSLSNCFFSFC